MTEGSPTKFFCIGAQKSGSTTLHDTLSRHPSIYLPEVKETKFFVYDERYEKGHEFYRSTYFAGRTDEPVIGEVDPDCLYFPGVAARIHGYCPKARLVLVLRNPVDRAYSHYQMCRRYGFEDQPFERAIELEASRVPQSRWNRDHYSYVERGYYARQLRPYLELFAQDRFHYLLTDELKSDFPGAMQRLCGFLGVEPIEAAAAVKSKTGASARAHWLAKIMHKPGRLRDMAKRYLRDDGLIANTFRRVRRLNEAPLPAQPMNPDTRARLKDGFKPDLVELERIIGRDLGFWYN